MRESWRAIRCWQTGALSPQQWQALQAALDAPVSAKPKLQKLLAEPGLLG